TWMLNCIQELHNTSFRDLCLMQKCSQGSMRSGSLSLITSQKDAVRKLGKTPERMKSPSVKMTRHQPNQPQRLFWLGVHMQVTLKQLSKPWAKNTAGRCSS